MALWASRPPAGRNAVAPPPLVMQRLARTASASPYMSPTRLKRRLGIAWRTQLHASADDLPAPAPVVQPVPSPVIADTPRMHAIRFEQSPPLRARFLAARPRTPLRPLQAEGIQWMLARERTREFDVGGGVVGDDMRMGKTLMAQAFCLEATQALVAAGEPRFGRPTLVCVPKELVPWWMGEWERWFGTDGLRVVLACEGVNVHTPLHALIRDADVVVTTYPTLHIAARGSGRYAALLDVHWRRVIADEAHEFINARTQLFHIMHTRLRADNKWFVSGTPRRNGTADLVAVFRFVGLAHVPAPGSAAFEQCRRVLVLRRRGVFVTPLGAGAADENTDTITTLDFATLAEERLYTYNTEHARTAPASERLTTITRMRQLCVAPPLLGAALHVPADVQMHADADVDAVAIKRAWLAQALHGTPLPQELVPSAATSMLLPPVFTKERWVLDYLRCVVEPRGEKLVVFSAWKEALQRLDSLLRLRARGGPAAHAFVHGKVASHETRRALLQAFQTQPQLSCLLATVGTAGRGIDLTAANHVIILNLGWTPATEKQAIARLMGLAQLRPLHVWRLVVRDTIDEPILEIQRRKDALDPLLPTVDVAMERPLPQPQEEEEVAGTLSELMDYIMGRVPDTVGN